MGAGTAPRGSGTDKAPAVSAQTQGSTSACSSNSELLPHSPALLQSPITRTVHSVPIATFSGRGRMDSIVDLTTIRNTHSDQVLTICHRSKVVCNDLPFLRAITLTPWLWLCMSRENPECTDVLLFDLSKTTWRLSSSPLRVSV